MSAETTYFRSEHPQVQEWWEEHQRQQKAFEQRLCDFAARYPNNPMVVIERGWFRWKALGLAGSQAPSDKWHQKAGEDYWTPDGRTRDGKALWSRLRAMTWDVPHPPGYPDIVMAHERRRMFHACVQELAGAFWIATGATVDEVESQRAFDPQIWQRAKASDYHLACERAEMAELRAKVFPEAPQP